ncbi:MAG: GNAT family N-acetyltransferase [Desulfobulbaceae bacterium]|nr:GNAT family N-acetyltransferase [Desulfobulbaceae bacterium]
MEAPVTIRPAVPEDIDALIPLLAILFSIEEDFVFNEGLQRRGLQMMIDNERRRILVAETNGKIIGMCSGQQTISTAEGGPALLVEDVIIHAEYRGLGIGRRLMEKVAEWGKMKGASRLQLLTDRNNTQALKFYTKLGWQATELICLRKTF